MPTFFQSIALILVHSPLFLLLLQTRWERKAQLNACVNTCFRNEAVYLYLLCLFASHLDRREVQKGSAHCRFFRGLYLHVWCKNHGR